MANSIFLSSLNGWMVLTLKRIPWTWISVVSLGSRVCHPKLEPFSLKKSFRKLDILYMGWKYSDGDWESFGNELVQMWRWFLKIDWKQLVQIAIQLRSWLYLGICCAPSTLRSNLGIPAFHEFWEPTSWCPFSCVSNRHQLMPSDPAPKTHAHLVAGQLQFSRLLMWRQLPKLPPKKGWNFQTSPNHRLHVWHRMGFSCWWKPPFFGGWFFTEDSMDSQCPLKVLGCHSGKDGATMAEASWFVSLSGWTKTGVFGCFLFQRLILHYGKFTCVFPKKGGLGRFLWRLPRFSPPPTPPAGMGGMPGAQTSLYSFWSLVDLWHSNLFLSIKCRDSHKTYQHMTWVT